MSQKNIKTLDDIAALCSVSASTVSRVLNNEPGISKDTRNKVLQTVEKYNFSIQKRKKQGGRAQVDLAIVIPDQSEIVGNPFFDMAEIMDAINTVFATNKKRVEVFTFNEFQSVLESKQFHSDGIIFAFGSINESVSKVLKSEGLPYVFLNRTFEEDNYVSCNHFKGMVHLVEYCGALGHKKIGYLGYSGHPINKDRYRGYSIGNYELTGSYNRESVFQVDGIDRVNADSARFFIDQKCDAVLCFNDNFAIRLIGELNNIGIKVPMDISVTGFDNSPTRKIFKPEITTISLSTYEMGFFAARWLKDNIINKSSRTLHCEVEGELLKGKTVKNR